jgi:hypothetical protein
MSTPMVARSIGSSRLGGQLADGAGGDEAAVQAAEVHIDRQVGDAQRVTREQERFAHFAHEHARVAALDVRLGDVHADLGQARLVERQLVDMHFARERAAGRFGGEGHVRQQICERAEIELNQVELAGRELCALLRHLHVVEAHLAAEQLTGELEHAVGGVACVAHRIEACVDVVAAAADAHLPWRRAAGDDVHAQAR